VQNEEKVSLQKWGNGGGGVHHLVVSNPPGGREEARFETGEVRVLVKETPLAVAGSPAEDREKEVSRSGKMPTSTK
jgi:hypothetical protein